MNWFKRLLNKVTEEEPTDDLGKTDYIERKEESPEKAEVGRPKFRFPLIPDEGEVTETEPLPAPPPPKEVRAPREQFAPSGGGRLPLPKHLRDVGQQSRRTWEERPPVRRDTMKTKFREVPESTVRAAMSALEERPQPPKQTRGFRPSVVPSPVYGFKKPTPPEEKPDPLPVEAPETGLADRIREREESDSGRSAEKVINEHATGSELPLPQAKKATSDSMQNNARAENVRVSEFEVKKETQKTEKPSELVITRVSDLKTSAEAASAEQPKTAVTEDQPAEVPVPERKEISAEPIVEERTVQTEVKTEEEAAVPRTSRHTRKSGTPFNVVMLKSDKQKLEQIEQLKGLKPSVNQGSALRQEKEPAADQPSLNAGREEPEVSVRKPEEKIHVEPVRQEEPPVPESNAESHSGQESIDEEDLPHYVFPDKEFLIEPETNTKDSEWMESQAAKLEEALSYFSVKAEVIGMVQGPAVTQFELKVGHGTKVSKIRNLQDDLKLALAARDIRIQAPIPGKSSIGIEIPNRVSRPVRISEVINSESFETSESPLEAVLGLDLAGRPSTIDLRKMPHGLIAGATGSGKSVCINSILTSLLYKASPEELRLLLIDPKMVELAPYNRIPHLVSPVITDVKAANAALKWAVGEMERRYELFAHGGVRDIARYNKKAEEHREFNKKLPYLLIVIDELADLMMVAPAEVEESICRIAQKARACGIHLVIATQRPSVDVITGLIKANVPTRIAFSVSSQVDSRTIIDVPGAERLLGKGDMLYLGNGMSAPARLQGTFVTDDEIERVIEFVRHSGEPDYLFRQEELIKQAESHESEDPLFDDACRFIAEAGSASTSMLQRKFSIGYNRAARLIDMLEDRGFVSPQKGSKPRDVYLTEEAASVIEQPGGPAHTI